MESCFSLSGNSFVIYFQRLRTVSSYSPGGFEAQDLLAKGLGDSVVGHSQRKR